MGEKMHLCHKWCQPVLLTFAENQVYLSHGQLCRLDWRTGGILTISTTLRTKFRLNRNCTCGNIDSFANARQPRAQSGIET